MWSDDEFDISRAILNNSDESNLPPFQVRRTRPLNAALADQEVPPETSVLLIEHQGRGLVFITVEMVYHHVAQIELPGQPMMVSFCAICNAGMCFSPIVDGQVHHFVERGLYNAMTLLGDEESGSLWDHISGKCLYGPLQGKQLTHVGALLHTTAAQALAAYPDAQLALSRLSPGQWDEALEWDAYRTEKTPEFSLEMVNTMGAEDTRLPRLDMGLGIWDGSAARYYPLTRLHSHNNIVIDRLNERPVLIYIDPASDTPSAMYIDKDVQSATWIGNALRLNTGATIRETALYEAQGVRQIVERPMQLFVRWYGFAFVFPRCDIYAA